MLNFTIKKHRKAFSVILIYIVFAFIAVILCCLFPSADKNANVAFFVGVAGTIASLYSVYVSAKDEERAKRESKENNRFLKKLSKKLGFVLADTTCIKEDFDEFLNSYLHSNLDDDTGTKNAGAI